jgi:hypothetical protein
MEIWNQITCSTFTAESEENTDESAEVNGVRPVERGRFFLKDLPCSIERSDFKNFSARLLIHFKQPAIRKRH